MSRIGNAGQAYLLQAQMLRIQDRTLETQRQISTGYKSNDYAGLGGDAGPLLGAQSLLARTEQQQKMATQLKPRLEFADAALGTVEKTTQGLRDEILKALSTNNAELVMTQVEAAFSQFSAAISQQFDGEFIFSGGRTDTPPLNVASVADLLALPDAASAFQDGALQSTIVLEDGATFSHGAFATDFGLDMMTAIRDIAEFNAGADGPFAGEITAAQRTFLESTLATFSDAGVAVRQAVADNGVAQVRLQDISDRHEASVNMLKTFIGDVQDADMAEAIARLNQDQVALQAAYKVVGDLGQSSLLDFLR